MRRLTTVLVSALLVLLFVLPAAASAAPEAAAAEDVVLLATEAGGDLPGTVPPGPNSDANPNPPENYQSPFLQNAAKGLLTAMVLLVLALGGLYYLLVQRPRTAAQQ